MKGVSIETFLGVSSEIEALHRVSRVNRQEGLGGGRVLRDKVKGVFVVLLAPSTPYTMHGSA